MTPEVIKTAEEHQAALREIEALARSDAQPGTPDGDRLEFLAVLVERYEKEHFPLDPWPDPGTSRC